MIPIAQKLRRWFYHLPGQLYLLANKWRYRNTTPGTAETKLCVNEAGVLVQALELSGFEGGPPLLSYEVQDVAPSCTRKTLKRQLSTTSNSNLSILDEPLAVSRLQPSKYMNTIVE